MNGQEEGTHYRAGSTHTALSPGSRVGMRWGKDVPMDTEEHKSFHGWQYQASRILPSRDRTFHFVDSQHPPVGSGLAL